MPDNTKERRAADRRKSIPLQTGPSPYTLQSTLLVIPDDLTRDFHMCKVSIDGLDGYGAWLKPLDEEHQIPTDDDLLLIAFEGEWVLTHHARVLKREGSRVLVEAPSVTEREKSQLAPSTGRHDYRIKVNLPVRVRSAHDGKDSSLKLARLIDLSRGGMALSTPLSQNYSEGDKITVRVVSWDHTVQIDAVVARITDGDEDGKQRLALQFPDDMTVQQRESVSTFIIQAQRRDALGRSLPTENE